MTDPDKLLARHKPAVKYDSQECYFADSAAEWTDNPGNVLTRANGELIAATSPRRGERKLSLSFLDEKEYANGEKVMPGDRIGDPTKDYKEQARRLHEQERYPNRVYGRHVKDGREAWLQYWFFYFYNDYNLIGPFLHAGCHEGDWEMIQLRLGSGGVPDYAVYAQHSYARGRDWRQVDKLPGTEQPIVYVSRGSHASYFEPGLIKETEHWVDYADGKRPRSPELKLEIVREDEPKWGWIKWPGSWGDTKKGKLKLDSASPTGPAEHDQWEHPSALLKPAAKVAAPPVKTPPVPPRPRVRARRVGKKVRLAYEVERTVTGVKPTALLVTVNSPDERRAPPTSRVYEIGRRKSGTIDLPADRVKRYDIYVSAATAREGGRPGLGSESVRIDVDRAPRSRRRP